MNDTYWTAEAMIIYGGSFVQALGLAFRNADDENLQTLKMAFPAIWGRYHEIGQKLKADDEAKEASL